MTTRCKNTPLPTLKRGSVLVAIFWIMSILAFAVVASVSVVQMQSDTVTANTHGKHARALAEKGIAIAIHTNIKRSDPLLNYESESSNEGYSSTFESMSTTFGFNSLVNELTQNQDENDAFNSVSTSLLGLIFIQEWGMDAGDATILLNSLSEWVDENDEVNTLEGWERFNYENAGITGRPYNRYFKSLNEVELVHGYEHLENVKPDWKSYFNIWTTSQIDLSSASPEIISLASITEAGKVIDIDGAQLIYERVIGDDGIRDTEDDLENGEPAQLLSEYSVGDTSGISSRYKFEGANQEFSLIKSRGWSGQVSLTVEMALQGRASSPLILERVETLSYE